MEQGTRFVAYLRVSTDRQGFETARLEERAIRAQLDNLCVMARNPGAKRI